MPADLRRRPRRALPRAVVAAVPRPRPSQQPDTDPDPVRAAATAPDPVSRFPFHVTDPDAVPVRRPAGPRGAALEPDVSALPPGPELAALLTQLDPAEVTDHALAELAAAAVRVSSWAHAVAARYGGLLAERESMNPDRSVVPRHAPVDVAGDELAMRLAWSRRSAESLVRDGRRFGADLAATGDALARGEIDVVRARVLADRLADLPVPVALDVQDVVLPSAPHRTARQVAADVDRALIRVDPDEAAARRTHARTRRRVDRPRVLPDGMAGLYAVLPAPTATRIHTTLDAAARTARAAGDPRTLDQLRADGLADLVLHPACSGDGAPAEGEMVDADPVDGPADGPTDEPSTTTPCPARRRPVTQVLVTVAMSTLLGLDEEPGDLAGYGPVDAPTARALAEGGVWQRLVTDPLSGAVLDLGRTRYRPTAALAAHVRARDRTCVRPGCSAAAASCDLDHTNPFHDERGRDPGDPLGTTSADNLAPLCRRDHVLKTEGGHRLRQRAPGEFVWTTPTGHVYETRPGTEVDPADLRPVPIERRAGFPELYATLPDDGSTRAVDGRAATGGGGAPPF